MDEEIWKNTEYDGYIVSNKGRVKSKNKILAQNDNGRGYLTIIMSINNHRFRRYVHRLVAKAFIPNPENKPEVNHIDGNKFNNHLKNLEWVTAKENMAHARETGLVSKYGYHTKESNKKISETVKRLWKEGVYKRRTSEDWTPEQRERARQAQLNSPNKKRGGKHPCAQRVRCVETGEIFECIRFADRKYGGSGVKGIFGKKQKTAYGYHWEKLK